MSENGGGKDKELRNAEWEKRERPKNCKKIKKFATANLSAGGFDVLFLPYSLVPEKL
jgi:hypothetical protein